MNTNTNSIELANVELGITLSRSLETRYSLNITIESLTNNSEPIFINGNLELNHTAVIKSWPGNGTSNNPYIIENLIINSTGLPYGITVSNTNLHLILRNNTISNGGIFIEGVDNLLLTNNTAFNGSLRGFYARYSSNLSFSNNTSAYSSNQGFLISYTENISLFNNFALNSASRGFELNSNDQLIFIKNNSALNNHGDGIYLISTSNSAQASFENNYVEKNNGIGLEVDVNNSLLSGNIAINNSVHGIYVVRDTNTYTVIGNTIENNTLVGLQMSGKNNKVFNNTIRGNGNNGISAGEVTSAHIYQNLIQNNLDRGILLSGFNSTIENNTIQGNDYFGLELGATNNNTVSKNIFRLNRLYGVKIYPFSDSHNNSIYLNIFDRNHLGFSKQQAVDNFPKNVNYWFSGNTGNYWSDYTAKDNDDDGIGDTPYNLDLGGTDPYPLITTDIIYGITPSSPSSPSSPRTSSTSPITTNGFGGLWVILSALLISLVVINRKNRIIKK